MPRKPWVGTDFRSGWVSPEALSNTALNYAFLPRLSRFNEGDGEEQWSFDPELPGIADLDGGFLAAGNRFAPYPYSLIASNGDSPARSVFPGESGSGPVAGRGPVADRRFGPVEQNAVTPVPEPATSGLLAILCAILAVSGYRRMGKLAAQFK